MEQVKKPSKAIAILITIAAVCSMISFFLMLVSDKGSGLVVFQFITASLMTFIAIVHWVRYAKSYVEFEVKNRLEETKKE